MDKMIIFSFTGEGTQLNRKLNQFCKRNEIPVESYSVERYAENEILPLPQKSQEFIRENWGKSGFIFIGAAGIAVRWIAPFVKDKFTDSPVLVMDEKGKYVIPILSGHIGGAVELAEQIGMWIEAEVVHTTATDVQQKFAVDVFARKYHLLFKDRKKAKEISAAVLEGEKIACLIEDQDIIIEGKIPKELIICRSREVWEPYPYKVKLESFREKRTEKAEEPGKMKNPDAEKEGILLLRTRNIAAGIGCRKGISEEVLEQGLKEVLKEYGLEMEQLCGLASIDLKKEEAGLMQLSEKYKIPFVTYNADELMKIRSVSDSSDFVKKVTGVDNVCERAVRTYVPDGKLICPKYRKEKMTVALVEEPVRIRF